MPQSDPCFITFTHSIESYSLPERFTFPFYYQPHPLCELAAKELQHYLSTQNEWLHNFGLTDDKNNASGKMFGILLVKNTQKEIGYLTAFSGKLCGEYTIGRFVPSVPETKQLASQPNDRSGKEFYEQFDVEQIEINKLTTQLTLLESNPQLTLLQNELLAVGLAFQKELTKHQEIMAVNRKNRKEQRIKAEQALDNESLTPLFNQLAKESVHDKNQLKILKHNWQQKIDNVQQQLNTLEHEIAQLKNERQNRSSILQNQLFQQYQLLNKNGCSKSLQEIFKPTPQQVPPSGSGDCAAPKLIQYAFKNNYKILAMAEFWWGVSPKSEIRQHKNYYPACSGKCEPILNWMLEGIEQDENPLLVNTVDNKQLDILYQDEVMAIINKPHDMLSVPGKHIQDSVYTRIKQLIPSASGPIIVHRLDMSTSGLMVIALTKRAHKQLQKQFIQREVHKRYVALLDGIIETETGEITLPLMGDFYNRPRQLVCTEIGKPAHTTWQVIGYTKNNKTKVYLSPKTGRTHQLRVHSAHILGLNTPIVGDDLYGTTANRLHLHAEQLTLKHPLTKKELTFQSAPDF
ncbi:pseudouridine synthase [Colwellia sp. RE-S-Sl-9]